MTGKIMGGGRPPLPSHVASILPAPLCEAVGQRCGGPVEELRLRAGRVAFAVCGGENVPLGLTVDGGWLSDILVAACGGSLYAYAESIAAGFVPMAGGVRLGVAGRPQIEEGRVRGVREVTALCFRIPSTLCVPMADLAQRVRCGEGLLLYAPPGGGKTTALRSLARALSGGPQPLRVVVVDTRGELAAGLASPGLSVDILAGYPRGVGLEIALRSFSPQVLVCDELYGEAEARAVLMGAASGVVFVASAHGDTLPTLLARPDIATLHQAGIFADYIRVER